MKNVALPIVLSVIAVSFDAGAQPNERLIAVTHAQILDVRNGSIVSDMHDCRARAHDCVRRYAPPPADADVLDARGRVVLPGLIDAHAHISDIAGARVALLSGVTTARSAGVPMFADVALREMVKAGYLAGPGHPGRRRPPAAALREPAATCSPTLACSSS